MQRACQTENKDGLGKPTLSKPISVVAVVVVVVVVVVAVAVAVAVVVRVMFSLKNVFFPVSYRLHSFVTDSP